MAHGSNCCLTYTRVLVFDDGRKTGCITCRNAAGAVCRTAPLPRPISLARLPCRYLPSLSAGPKTSPRTSPRRPSDDAARQRQHGRAEEEAEVLGSRLAVAARLGPELAASEQRHDPCGEAQEPRDNPRREEPARHFSARSNPPLGDGGRNILNFHPPKSERDRSF